MRSDSIKAEEERKRDRAYDPLHRWRHIQAAITWAEANMPPYLRRNRPRTHKSGPPPKKDEVGGPQTGG